MKEYMPKKSNASLSIRYALMSMALMTVCYTTIKDHLADTVSADRISMLLITFNVISVGFGVIASVVADKLSDKHTGVRLAVLLALTGYMLPVKFGIDIKVVLMGLGSAIFYAFASSSIYAKVKDKGQGVGLLIGGSIAGIAFASFAGFIGHLFAPLLMICASPADRCESRPVEEKPSEKPKNSYIALPFLMLAYTLLFFLFSSFNFDWNTFFKTNVKMLLVIAAGRAAGGFLSGLIDRATVIFASVCIGGLILFTSSESRMMSFIGLFVLSAALAPLLLSAKDKLPSAPALSYALMGVAAYFGQVMSFTVEYKPSMILMCCAAVIIIAIWTDDFKLVGSIMKKVKTAKDDTVRKAGKKR